jgi:hypothetical protein
MIQADSVYITAPTNTSAIDYPMMFPPRDPTRRRFLAVAAVASAVGAGTLAAATQAANVPQAVTVPIGPDPIYAVIEAHRKAALDHNEAERIQYAYDEEGGKDEGDENTTASCCCGSSCGGCSTQALRLCRRWPDEGIVGARRDSVLVSFVLHQRPASKL